MHVNARGYGTSPGEFTGESMFTSSDEFTGESMAELPGESVITSSGDVKLLSGVANMESSNE